MPNFSNSSTSQARLRLLLRFRSPSKLAAAFSSFPTQEDITHLILQQKSPSKALQTFRWASQIPNFLHSQSTYKALVQKLCGFRQFQTVDKILEEMPSSIGSTPNEAIFLTIVRGYGRVRMIKRVIAVLDSVHRFGNKPSLKIFNSILDVLVGEDIDLARDFYREKMMGTGVEGDDYTFGILMKGLCSTNRIGDSFKLLALMKSRGLKPNTVIYNTLIHSLCRNGKVGRARSLMREMVEPNDVTFNIMISEYCKEGNLVQALVMLEKCFSLRFIPDVITVTKVVELLCTEGREMEAVEVLERVEKKMGGLVDTVAYNTLIAGFCRLGKVKVGLSFLKEMERKGSLPNRKTYNVLINAFSESGNLDSALDLFREMSDVGIIPDLNTYDMLIRGLCSVGRIEEGLKVLGLMEERRGRPVDTISPYNGILYGFYRENRLEEAQRFLVEIGKHFPRAADRSLRILVFCKEGTVADAMEVYNEMVHEGDSPSALVYAYLIDGLCEVEKVRSAFKLMNEMVVKAYFPTKLTFNSLISGFCRKGDVGSASKLVEEMTRRGCLLDGDSYRPLIGAFCNGGDFQRAFGIFMQMVEKGIVPNHSMWNSLLLSLMENKKGPHQLVGLDWICGNW